MHNLRLLFGAWFLNVYLHQLIVCGELSLTSVPKTCICPGDVVIYECSVMGIPSGFTTFSGESFINCPEMGDHQALILPHNTFNQPQGFNSTCNNGKIIGRSLSVDNGTYTSQLMITVTPELIGDAIECRYDNGTHISEVGNSIINDTVFSSSSPVISKVEFNSKQLTFSWNPLSTDCSTIHYNILSSNCGSCPTTGTNHTTVTCVDMPVNNDVCTFAVQTVHCGNLTDNSANQSLTVNVTETEKDTSMPPLREDCPITFNVESSCSSCPTTANYTTVTCTNEPIDGSECIVTMQALVCGNIIGNASIFMIPISNVEEGNIYIVMNSSNNLGTIISTCVLAVLLIVGTAVSTTVIIKSKVKIQAEAVVQRSGNIPNYEEISLDTNRNIAYGTRVQ